MDRATARDHRRPNGGIADPEPRGHLSERQTIRVEPGSVLTDRVGKFRLARLQPRLACHLPHRAAMHLEARRKLPDRLPSGVPGERFSAIRGCGVRLIGPLAGMPG